MASVGGKETTGELEGKGKSRPEIGDGETWRTSFFLFISFLRPALERGRGGRFGRGHGEILAVPCGDRSIGFQILKRLGGDGEGRETGKGGKSAEANPACAAPWFAFPSPGAPAVHKYGI